MLPNFKTLYSRSVDLLKQVQEQVQAKPSSSIASPTASPVKSPPGNDFVVRHEKQWDKIVTNGVKISSSLVAQDGKVKVVADRCEGELSAWNNLQSELSTMGSIVDSVDSLRAEMEALCGQLEHLDMALDDHLQAKEQRDMLRWKKEINHDTESFKLSRAKELANFERTLKAEHARRIRQKAEEDSRALREAEIEKRNAQKRAEAQMKKEKEAEKSQKTDSGVAADSTAVPETAAAAADEAESTQPEAKADDGAAKPAGGEGEADGPADAAGEGAE